MFSIVQKKFSLIFDGFNSTLFVYGQTGAGKTYIAVNLLKRISDAGQLKRALFLCDRDELRSQGLGAFYDEFGSDAAAASTDNPEKNGCPKEYKLIVIKKDRIEIKQQVHFETAKATIKRSSYPLLAEVADAIKSAELKGVRIEGHTDSDGSELYNLKLSQARADSVRTHLVEIEGIDSSLLEAIGFGESRPLASNDTPGGKAKNRRVEFHISR